MKKFTNKLITYRLLKKVNVKLFIVYCSKTILFHSANKLTHFIVLKFSLLYVITRRKDKIDVIHYDLLTYKVGYSSPSVACKICVNPVLELLKVFVFTELFIVVGSSGE